MASRSGAYPILFLTLVVFLSVVALTLIDRVTRDKIVAAQQAEVQEMLATLFPELDAYRLDQASHRYTVVEGGEIIGHALTVQATGYGGVIDLLVGIEPDRSLRGIRVVSQQETPGLGAKIVEPSFVDQFVGLSADRIALRMDGGAIDAITGATISSSAVVEAIRAALIAQFGEGGG